MPIYCLNSYKSAINCYFFCLPVICYLKIIYVAKKIYPKITYLLLQNASLLSKFIGRVGAHAIPLLSTQLPLQHMSSVPERSPDVVGPSPDLELGLEPTAVGIGSGGCCHQSYIFRHQYYHVMH
jgi:hypothetical protein